MNKKDIVILKLWDNEEVIVEMNIEHFLEMQREDLNQWVKEFYISSMQRTICYSDIKWKQGKTQYLSIEAPKNEPTLAEKEKSAEILRKLAKKAEEWKEKRFIERRNEILEDLRKKEVALGLETTIDKIEWYNKLKLTK